MQNSISLRTRMLIILVGASMAALAAVSLSLIVYEQTTFKARFSERIKAYSVLVSSNLPAAISFQNEYTAVEILQSLGDVEGFVRACVFQKEGNLFASYRSSGLSAPCRTSFASSASISEPSWVTETTPVSIKGDVLGWLEVVFDMPPLRVRLLQYGIIVLCVTLALGFAALVSALSFREYITRPVLRLAEIAQRIGREKDYSLRASALRKDEIGALATSINEMLDTITERSLSLQRELIERQQAEKEKEQLSRQLYHAQKIETLGTLAGGIAHDFNNLLTPIIGYLELALQRRESEPLREYLDKVLSGCQRAASLVRQILAFSGKAEKKLQPVKLQKVVEEAFQLLWASTPSTIELRSELASDCPVVIADATQLHQVIMNLVSNAVHAIGESTGIVRVSVVSKTIDSFMASQSPDLHVGDYVLLTISDTGKGMDEVTRERLFEPFFTTRQGKGTGLGLSVVHGIVKSFGGAILVKTKLGEGSEFEVYFPAGSEQRDETTSVQKTEIQRIGNILLVDDQEDVLNLTKTMLEASGYRVTAIQDPIGALEVFLNDVASFDLLVTDQTMPHMRGIDLVAGIRKHRPNLPAIIMSGYHEAVTEEVLNSIEGVTTLWKPFNLNTLLSIVQRALAGG